jgi:acyl-[acyl-carrier-protein]-phospholipid O-acyltransferase/long-chain-fatty-acid--[acyl-carrier-protein] ligase
MRWLKLFLLNFVGVLNDNFMKHCIIFVSVGWVMPEWMTQSQLISAVSAALVLPYLLLSPYSGEIAERFEKQKIVRLMKLLELPIVALAGIGFWIESVWIVLLAVLLMGAQSCLYSPAKYGLIRDVDGERGVAFGSGMFEMMAFLGILVGTIIAAYISDNYAWWIVAGMMIILALLGWGLSLFLGIKEGEVEQTKESRNPIRFLVESYRFASKHKGLNKAVFGASLLWLLGGLLQMNVVLHCTRTLGMSNTASSIILAMAAVGIAVGCSVAGKLIENRNRHNFIVGGLIGVVVALIIVLIFKPEGWVLGALIFLTAFSGGIFQVPCLAIVQSANIGRKLGSMLAYLNLLTFIFVLIGTAIFSLITGFTNQNSYAVFAVMLIITALSIGIFTYKAK